MAIESTDYLAIYQTTSGEIRKATVGALLAGASGDESLWKEDGSALTPKTTGADLKVEGTITSEGNLVVGQTIFSGPATNVGVEANADKGALHIRAANNTTISALEIISAGSQLSHLKVLGSGDLKIGTNVNQPADTGIELYPDGSATFATENIKLNTDGSIEAVSIDGGEYS